MEMLYRCIELIVMVLWTVFPPYYYDEDTFAASWWRCKASWSLLYAIGVRSAVQQVCEFWDEMRRKPWIYLSDLVNWLDWIVITIFLVFLAITAGAEKYNLAENWVLFSWIILLRWGSFIHSLRGYPAGSISTRILLLDSSSEHRAELRVIIIGAVLIFCTFWHVFVNLDDGDTFGMSSHRLGALGIATFRLLLQQDGAAMDGILNLGDVCLPQPPDRPNAGQWPAGKPGNWMTIPFAILGNIIFSIMVLNIMIGVYQNAFQGAGRRHQIHMKARAEICLHAFMQPKWPPRSNWPLDWLMSVLGCDALTNALGRCCFCLGRIKVANGEKSQQNQNEPKYEEQDLSVIRSRGYRILFIGLLAWAGLLQVPYLHPVVAGTVLLIAILSLDWALLARPWKTSSGKDKKDKDPSKEFYLWWCAPAAQVNAESSERTSMQELKSLMEQMEKRMQASQPSAWTPSTEHPFEDQKAVLERLEQLEQRLQALRPEGAAASAKVPNDHHPEGGGEGGGGGGS